jgi:hypothetical protein
MWQLLAIVFSAVVLFYLGAFYLTVAAWLNAIGHLFRGNFIRASIWACIGFGMLCWWQGSDVIPDPWDFDKWLKTSVLFVALVASIVLVVKFRPRPKTNVPPFETAPIKVELVNINIELGADRHADHRAVRGAIGTEQGPRRMPGPTIIDG